MKYEMRIPFFLAWKYLLRSNKWTLGLIIFFMSIAFVNMIFITSLFNGIIKGFNEQIINTTTGNIFIIPQTGLDTISNGELVRESVLDFDGVAAASTETYLSANLKFAGKKGNWPVIAINPDNERSVINVADKLTAGQFLSPSDTDTIILGSGIATAIDDRQENDPFSFSGIQVGDTVELQYGSSSFELTVKGIFKSNFIDADDRAFISTNTLKKINPQYEGDVSRLIVKTDAGTDEEKLIVALKIGGIKQNIFSWRDASNLMDTISSSFLSINVILSSVGILIAAITVFIVIYIDIAAKRQQIGILRAIGIKPYIIRSMYVILSAVYSVAGIMLGTGLFFAILVPYFNAHPFELPIASVTLDVNFTDFIARMEVLIWVAIAAGLVPSILITRIKILDAIWGR